jgi:C1A family cysteine protease
MDGFELDQAILSSPVSVEVEADQDVWQHYKSGIVKATDCGETVNHAVLVVGYNEDSYIVKNSWGANWGEEGYIRLERNGNTDTCGILTAASYPRA